MSDRTYQDIRKQIVRSYDPDQPPVAVRLDPTDSEIVRQRLAHLNHLLIGELANTPDNGVKIMGIPCVLDAERTEVVFQEAV